MPRYAARWWQRTWKETSHFWTFPRWWVSFAGPIATLLVYVARYGWAALGNLPDSLTAALLGIGIGFFGTLIVHSIRAVKLLDDERATHAASLQRTIDEQAAQINALRPPPRTRLEQRYYEDATTYLARLNQEEKLVLQAIMLHGRLVGGRVSGIHGVQHDRVMAILNHDALHPLVKREEDKDVGLGLRTSWTIVPGYQKALEELL